MSLPCPGTIALDAERRLVSRRQNTLRNFVSRKARTVFDATELPSLVAQHAMWLANYPIIGIERPIIVDRFWTDLDEYYASSKWTAVGATADSLMPIRIVSERPI